MLRLGTVRRVLPVETPGIVHASTMVEGMYYADLAFNVYVGYRAIVTKTANLFRQK